MGGLQIKIDNQLTGGIAGGLAVTSGAEDRSPGGGLGATFSLGPTLEMRNCNIGSCRWSEGWLGVELGQSVFHGSDKSSFWGTTSMELKVGQVSRNSWGRFYPYASVLAGGSVSYGNSGQVRFAPQISGEAGLSQTNGLFTTWGITPSLKVAVNPLNPSVTALLLLGLGY